MLFSFLPIAMAYQEVSDRGVHVGGQVQTPSSQGRDLSCVHIKQQQNIVRTLACSMHYPSLYGLGTNMPPRPPLVVSYQSSTLNTCLLQMLTRRSPTEVCMWGGQGKAPRSQGNVLAGGEVQREGEVAPGVRVQHFHQQTHLRAWI